MDARLAVLQERAVSTGLENVIGTVRGLMNRRPTVKLIITPGRNPSESEGQAAGPISTHPDDAPNLPPMEPDQ